MPRKLRIFIPNQPQHVVVRGHNRNPILMCDNDFQFLYQCLYEAAEKHNLSVHAWVFMNNHLHLLVTPATAEALPRTMQSTGRRYAYYFNRTYQRSGALWQDRYKSSPVDTENYLLACYRYIELNPVRANIVRQPENYIYSSYHANALEKPDKLVTPHPVFLAFFNSKQKRKAYIELCQQSLSTKELENIRKGTEKGIGIGQADFLIRVAKLTA